MERIILEPHTVNYLASGESDEFGEWITGNWDHPCVVALVERINANHLASVRDALAEAGVDADVRLGEVGNYAQWSDSVRDACEWFGGEWDAQCDVLWAELRTVSGVSEWVS